MQGRYLLGLAAVAFVVAFLVPVVTIDWISFFGRIHADVFLWETLEIPKQWSHVPSFAGNAIPCALFVATWLMAFFWPLRLPRGLPWAVWAVVAYLTWALVGIRYIEHRVGYYLLIASFVLLGLALHRIRRERLAASSGQPPVALP